MCSTCFMFILCRGCFILFAFRNVQIKILLQQINFDFLPIALKVKVLHNKFRQPFNGSNINQVKVENTNTIRFNYKYTTPKTFK